MGPVIVLPIVDIDPKRGQTSLAGPLPSAI
jgi:hypothetical protein